MVDFVTTDDLGVDGVSEETARTPPSRMQSLFPTIGSPYGEFETYSGDFTVYERRLQFYNEKPIWEPVSGDITPDDVTLASTAADLTYLALPEFAIPIGKPGPIDDDADVPRSVSRNLFSVLIGYDTTIVDAEFAEVLLST